MPILKQEDDVWPRDLFDNEVLLADSTRKWWCIYTLSRREKDLMRKLLANQVPFYGPVIAKRYRSPTGRLRTSFIPLFANYVFMFADDQERYQALTSNCISKCEEVLEHEALVRDLKQIFDVVKLGVPLTPEAKLEPGDRIRVRSGPFAGYEGVVIRREGKTRLLLSIKFLEQGVSMAIDEGLLEVQ